MMIYDLINPSYGSTIERMIANMQHDNNVCVHDDFVVELLRSADGFLCLNHNILASKQDINDPWALP